MILTALNEYYQRLAKEDKVPQPGFSTEQISYEILINQSGVPLQVNFIGSSEGSRQVPRPLKVPQSFKRPGTTPKPFFLWDKTSYLLGVKKNNDALEGMPQHIISEKEHHAFKKFHQELLKHTENERLCAFVAFLEHWKPEMFEDGLFSSEMLDKNFVMRLDGDKYHIHETEAAEDIQKNLVLGNDVPKGLCLVTGKWAPIARLHASIKNIEGAHTAGASIVTFNKDAFESYGKKQGENAPVSEDAAFGYTTALNYLLRRSSSNQQRLQIADTTVVFWATAQTSKAAKAAENFFAVLNQPPSDEQEASKLGSLLADVADGRPLKDVAPELEPETQFYVLGLTPSGPRLSIRFWLVDSLEHLTKHYAQHYRDLDIQPAPWKGIAPSAEWLTRQTAPIRGKNKDPKTDDVLPQLAGEMMRAIITGQRYPRSLLTNVVMRFRSDGNINGLRVALCKAVLAREARLATHSNSNKQEVSVSLDKSSTHPGYLLGRLFAELENAQRGALGRELNATIKDRYYGAASATPASVFPMLLRNVQNHLSSMRKKDKGGIAYTIESEISQIIDGLGDTFPRSLRIEEQGRFAIGYYHQSQTRFAKKDNANSDEQSEQGDSE